MINARTINDFVTAKNDSNRVGGGAAGCAACCATSGVGSYKNKRYN